jgi:hypothetical protein
MAAKLRTAEAIAARIAARQQGVVTREQLLAAGVTRHEIARLVRRGALIRMHRGVYRVGHGAPSVLARYMAAVLACGDGAVLSGRAAAHLHSLVKGPAATPEVTTTRDRQVKGVKVRRVRTLPRGHVIRRRSIPVTSVPRTLVDLAAIMPTEELGRACHEAVVKHGTTPGQVERVLAQRPGAAGAPTLRRIMVGDEPVTLSRLERRFLNLLRAAGLPLPVTNRRFGAHWVDCRWPEFRLTVELHSYRFHNSRRAWENDRQRERDARGRGDEFRRYTWADLEERPSELAGEIAALVEGRSYSYS